MIVPGEAGTPRGTAAGGGGGPAPTGTGASAPARERGGRPPGASAPRSRTVRGVWLLVILFLVVGVGGSLLWLMLSDRGEHDRPLAERLTAEGWAAQERAGNDPDSLARARDLYRKAVEADASYPIPWNNLGHLDIVSGDLQKAVINLTEAVRLDSTYAAAWANLGDAYEGLERYDDAQASYRRAILFGDMAEALAGANNLGSMYLERGRPGDALRILGQAVTAHADSAPAPLWKNYGRALLAEGRPAEADSAFARALRLAPGYPAALAGRARAAEALGAVEDARARWGLAAASAETAVAAEARRALGRLGR